MEPNEAYGTFDFWERRYQKEKDKTFEWFKDFSALEKSLSQFIPSKESTILQLGCGNSQLSEDMYKAGWKHILNVDYSPTVIESMSERTSHMKEMKWMVGDIYSLDSVLTEKVDYAIDKGTLDAILTQKHDPWDPEPEIMEKVTAYMTQVYNVLRPGGTFLQITFSQPHFRRRLIETAPWSVKTHKLFSEHDSFEYFIYEATK